MRSLIWLLIALEMTAAVSTSAAEIASAEYFLNTDPGPGNGTRVETPSSGSFASFNIHVPAETIAALPDGVHWLTGRVQDTAGEWSVAFSRPFLKQNPVAATEEFIVAAEYYIDTDPGPGNGTRVELSTPASLASFNIDVPAETIAALPDGIHWLTGRIQDTGGEWSIAFTRPFLKQNPLPETEALVEFIEYQWYREGLPASTAKLALADVPAIQISMMLEADITEFDNGVTYQLLVTPIDTLGQRGIGFTRSVLIDRTIAPLPFSIGSLERLANGTIRLTFEGEPGRNYTLQSSVDLREWQNLQVVVTGDTTIIEFMDEEPASPYRFFRLLTP